MTNTKINCVLLVDDNPADNFFHNIVITDESFAERIIARESVLEALDYLQSPDSPQPDLIFLDINMPRLDGWQFLERYQGMFPRAVDRVPVFMLTTSPDILDERKAEHTGMVAGFLQKPLEPQTLQDVKLKFNGLSQFDVIAD